MPDDPIKTAKGAVVTELIRAAGDDPHVKEAGRHLARTALTITKLIDNALLPLAAINFAFEKARSYFSNQFQQDMGDRASRIPAESIVEPKASIAGPALQGLAFAHEEPNLREMFLNLLATSMDGRVATNAHPAFVEVIKQLTSEEAALLQGILRAMGVIPIVEIRVSTAGTQGWVTLVRHVLDLKDATGGAATENPRIPAMVDNWVRLGLVEVDYMTHITSDASYQWVDERPEFRKCKMHHEAEGIHVTFQKGILRRTALGLLFASATGLT